MPIPNLSHPVPVILEQKNEANTVYDDDYREPIQQIARKEQVTVAGQILWDRLDQMDREEIGRRLNSFGYVLFRYYDLNAKGISLRIGDRIVKIGKQDYDLYITALMPVGHYPDQGGATMVRAYFNDRQPEKQGAHRG